MGITWRPPGKASQPNATGQLGVIREYGCDQVARRAFGDETAAVHDRQTVECQSHLAIGLQHFGVVGTAVAEKLAKLKEMMAALG